MRSPRLVAVGLGTLTGAAMALLLPAAGALASPTADLLVDPGPGWTLIDEQAGALDSINRTYVRADDNNDSIVLTAFPVTTPPGVEPLFNALSNFEDFDTTPEPSLGLAAWLVPAGAELDNDSFAMLVFATNDHLFTFRFTTQDGRDVDPRTLLHDLAVRQIAAAGGPFTPRGVESPERSKAESEVIALLPASAPDGYGLSSAITAAGDDELSPEDDVDAGVVDFLNDNSVTATRVWGSDDGTLIGAVSITRYPYDIFAAASIAEIGSEHREVISEDALGDVPDVIAYRGTGDDSDLIGTTFRRGDMFVIVLTQHAGDVSEDTAAALAADLTRATWNGLPAGGTTPYDFPSAPSKALGLVLTATIVTAAACGSMLVARLRARRVRQQWEGGELPPPELVDATQNRGCDRARSRCRPAPSSRRDRGRWPGRDRQHRHRGAGRRLRVDGRGGGGGGARRRVVAHPLLAAA